jgi:type 1 glutamine amidotransferase
VLATSLFEATPDTPWREDLVVPAVWTREWGAGRVFVSTIGHKLEDLDVPEVRTLTERGLLWAARAG